ncbi:hypothetical protein GWI33_015023 [Rhynchophorus ferrugineus]|uniref:Uncharacterized protein n=1 Tax=Rhynchophorus ferrugineus TaxID=354439 RepID=A0A834IE27_RHYFE|nr:hypothetical protein GWI33_015023 [Rhynchophorus ferrugineus]
MITTPDVVRMGSDLKNVFSVPFYYCTVAGEYGDVISLEKINPDTFRRPKYDIYKCFDVAAMRCFLTGKM